MSASTLAPVTCYGVVRTRTAQDEWYETASRDAGRRARALRKLGFRVLVSSMGSQVTSVGLVKMTLLSVVGLGYDDEVPEPEKVVRV